MKVFDVKNIIILVEIFSSINFVNLHHLSSKIYDGPNLIMKKTDI